MTTEADPASPTLIPRPPGLIASPHRSNIIVPFRDATHINICGVFHVYDPVNNQPERHYWLEDVRLWSIACRKFRNDGYTVFQFTEYSSPDAWFCAYPTMNITASLSTSDFDLNDETTNDGTHVTADSERDNIPRADAAAEAEREAELRRLQAELQRLRQQQEDQNRRQQQQAADNDGAVPEGIAFLNFLQQNQQMMQQQQQAFINVLQQMNTTRPAAATTPAPAAPLTKPTIEFPTWDGKFATKQDFIFQITTMKKDRFFARVTDWTQKLPGLEEQSNYLLASIIKNVPLTNRSIFSNDATVADDGFAMLHRLLENLQGTTVENQLLAITDLATLEFKADDTSATYMARIRALQTALQNVTIDQFLTLLTLSRLDTGLYPGTMALFRQGNTALLAEPLPSIEARLEKEDRLRTLMGETAESVRRTKAPRQPTAPTKPDGSTIVYPPSDKQLQYSQIRDLTKDTTTCPGCFATLQKGERCRKGYCFAFLTAGFILQYNPDEAQKILQELKNKSGKGGRNRGRRTTDKDNDAKQSPAPAPAATPPPEKEVVGSGKRATSADKLPASYSDAAARSLPPSKTNYYDELESDDDVDLGFFEPEDSNNSKNATSS